MIKILRNIFIFSLLLNLSIGCQKDDDGLKNNSNEWSTEKIIGIDDIQGISIIGYNGSSTEIITPKYINGDLVIAINMKEKKNRDKITSIDMTNSTGISSIYSLKNFSVLNEVKFPSSIKKIHSEAFKNCISLIDIDLSKQNNLTMISDRVFLDCINLKTISFPKSIQILGWDIISNTEIEEVDLSMATELTNLSPAFSSAGKLKKIKLPITITKIEAGAFQYSGLKDIDFTYLNRLTVIEGGVFTNCSNLETIKLPSSVNQIGDQAFRGCSSLEIIDLSNLTSLNKISDGLFIICEKLKDIKFPNSILSMGSNIFGECKSLKKIDLSNLHSLKILDHTFINCQYLESIILPNSINSIGKQEFYNCKSLLEIDLSGLINLKEIFNIVFMNCEKIVKIKLPVSIIKIDNEFNLSEKGAFRNCYSLKNINLKDLINIRYIPDNAFMDCKSLESIDIPKSIIYIGCDVFKNCTMLSTVRIDAESDNYIRINEDYNGPFRNTSFYTGEQNTRIFYPKNLYKYPSCETVGDAFLLYWGCLKSDFIAW